MARFLPYVLAFLGWVIPAKNLWADNAKLVQIYCQAMMESDMKGREPHSVNWNELQTRLERRKLEVKADTESFRKCVREHEDEFESAELILRNRERVRDSLREAKPTQEETTQLEVSGVTMEIKTSANYGINDKELRREVRMRADRYGQMWQRFLVSLKRKTSDSE